MINTIKRCQDKQKSTAVSKRVPLVNDENTRKANTKDHGSAPLRSGGVLVSSTTNPNLTATVPKSTRKFPTATVSTVPFKSKSVPQKSVTVRSKESGVVCSLFTARSVNRGGKPQNSVVTNLNNNNICVKRSRTTRSGHLEPRTKRHITIERGGQGQSTSPKGGLPPQTNSSGNQLKEASSISSLDSKHSKVAPVPPAKLHKSSSKEKLDRVPAAKSDKIRDNGTARGNGTKPPANSNLIPKNNNRLEYKETNLNGDTRNHNTPNLLPDTVEAAEVEIVMQELASVQQELEIMAREKASLALELATYQGEVHTLRNEVARMQNFDEQRSSEIEQLMEENSSLRCRLRDVAHSPLSDNEKQLILDNHRQHNSAPASFSTSMEGGGDAGTNGTVPPTSTLHATDAPSTCSTPNWDKHSTSSMSEVSVACLQDRILQMEETHYSTNEELQATLQELADLQTQLVELQSDYERLVEEKSVILESLYRQTEKLEDSRKTIETLHELLIHGDGQEPVEIGSDREQKLVDLLKTAQEEREALLSKQNDITSKLHELRQSASQNGDERDRLMDRVRLLETTVDSVHAERKQVDQELAQAKEQSSARRIEISRLTTLLENARSKIDELEKERDKGDRSEMDALLDAARKEKDTLESQVATLQGQVSSGQCENERVKEQLSLVQEELKVAKNNAKTVISDLEYKLGEAQRELVSLRSEVQLTKDQLAEAQAQLQRHLDDKRKLKTVLANTQHCLGEQDDRLQELEDRLKDEQRLRREENAEWEQFQRDLLITVRVANDFKTEAQTELEKLVHENKFLRDKNRALEGHLEKMRAVKPQTPPLLRQSSAPAESQQQRVFSSVQQEMAARRQKAGATLQDNRLSVKSLIESIENATKQVKAGPGGSRSSSTSSLNSIASDIRTANLTPTGNPATNLTTSGNGGEWTDQVYAKSPLREQQQIVSGGTNKNSRNTNGKNIISDGNYGGKTDGNKQDDTIRDSVSILNAKNIDFVRRNSYGDLSERKDPLNGLVKNGGSKRNALLKWCQQKTVGYRNIDITNFSSSWNDGLALCALLHTYLPHRVPYDTLVPAEKRRNFSLAFSAAESVGIPTTLNINDMCQLERPDWQQVMAYVTAIYKHFET